MPKKLLGKKVLTLALVEYPDGQYVIVAKERALASQGNDIREAFKSFGHILQGTICLNPTALKNGTKQDGLIVKTYFAEKK